MAAIYDVMVETQEEVQSRAIYILRDWVKKNMKIITPVNDIFVVSIPIRFNNVFKQHIYQQAFYSIFRLHTELSRDGGILASLPAWCYLGAYRTVSGRPVSLSEIDRKC